jgi:hypothetical protein
MRSDHDRRETQGFYFPDLAHGEGSSIHRQIVFLEGPLSEYAVSRLMSNR